MRRGYVHDAGNPTKKVTQNNFILGIEQREEAAKRVVDATRLDLRHQVEESMEKRGRNMPRNPSTAERREYPTREFKSPVLSRSFREDLPNLLPYKQNLPKIRKATELLASLSGRLGSRLRLLVTSRSASLSVSGRPLCTLPSLPHLFSSSAEESSQKCLLRFRKPIWTRSVPNSTLMVFFEFATNLSFGRWISLGLWVFSFDLCLCRRALVLFVHTWAR